MTESEMLNLMTQFTGRFPGSDIECNTVRHLNRHGMLGYRHPLIMHFNPHEKIGPIYFAADFILSSRLRAFVSAVIRARKSTLTDKKLQSIYDKITLGRKS